MVHAMLCRAIFESAGKLEAVSAVREYENLQRADSPTESLGLLQDVVFDAGRACASQVCNCNLTIIGLAMHVPSYVTCPSVSKLLPKLCPRKHHQYALG